jgi:multidrug resistance efflux pump
MTWANRLRLLGGLVVVFAIVAVFTFVFAQRQSHATSSSATIVAQNYPVGTDYGGIVVEQFVDEGDEVRPGDPIVAVRSLQLQRDLAAGIVTASTVASAATAAVPDDDGTMMLTATVDGTVNDLAVAQGGFAQAGGVVAVIERSDSLFVEAEFLLSARDYGRIEDAAPVELLLPNQRILRGHVESVDVETVLGEAKSTLRVVSDELVDGESNHLIADGTPVVATLTLRDDGPFAGAVDLLSDFIRKIGL